MVTVSEGRRHSAPEELTSSLPDVASFSSTDRSTFQRDLNAGRRDYTIPGQIEQATNEIALLARQQLNGEPTNYPISPVVAEYLRDHPEMAVHFAVPHDSRSGVNFSGKREYVRANQLMESVNELAEQMLDMHQEKGSSCMRDPDFRRLLRRATNEAREFKSLTGVSIDMVCNVSYRNDHNRELWRAEMDQVRADLPRAIERIQENHLRELQVHGITGADTWLTGVEAMPGGSQHYAQVTRGFTPEGDNNPVYRGYIQEGREQVQRVQEQRAQEDAAERAAERERIDEYRQILRRETPYHLQESTRREMARAEGMRGLETGTDSTTIAPVTPSVTTAPESTRTAPAGSYTDAAPDPSPVPAAVTLSPNATRLIEIVAKTEELATQAAIPGSEAERNVAILNQQAAALLTPLTPSAVEALRLELIAAQRQPDVDPNLSALYGRTFDFLGRPIPGSTPAQSAETAPLLRTHSEDELKQYAGGMVDSLASRAVRGEDPAPLITEINNFVGQLSPREQHEYLSELKRKFDAMNFDAALALAVGDPTKVNIPDPATQRNPTVELQKFRDAMTTYLNREDNTALIAATNSIAFSPGTVEAQVWQFAYDNRNQPEAAQNNAMRSELERLYISGQITGKSDFERLRDLFGNGGAGLPDNLQAIVQTCNTGFETFITVPSFENQTVAIQVADAFNAAQNSQEFITKFKEIESEAGTKLNATDAGVLRVYFSRLAERERSNGRSPVYNDLVKIAQWLGDYEISQ